MDVQHGAAPDLAAMQTAGDDDDNSHDALSSVALFDNEQHSDNEAAKQAEPEQRHDGRTHDERSR
jgi:hypothetical protein